MGRTGYFGCLVLLGVAMLSVSCLAVFGATGAITAERGQRPAAVAAPATGSGREPGATDRASAGAEQAAAAPTRSSEPGAAESVRREPGAPAQGTPAAAATARATQAPAEATVPGASPTREAAKPTAVPQGTVAPKPAAAGPEGNIAQRLDRESVGGSLKLRALGAAKTTQGDRAVLAIYVRMENVGKDPVRIDPAFFKLVDRSGTKYPISKVIEASLPAIELAPAGQPGGSGQNTEGNLTFEVPRTAAGLALSYEPTDGAAMRIPLPPEFG